MIHSEKRQATIFVDIEKECDRCHNRYHVDIDCFEAQEFHHINFVGGYGSIFGDGTVVECDLCQNCLKDLIGEFCRIDKAIQQ
jgi:hypothetical protein